MDGPASIVPIVEGPGDRDASPVLLRRILFERLARYDITVARPKKANGKQDLFAASGKLPTIFGHDSFLPGHNRPTGFG